jgi:hypothetical protein
MSGKRHHTIPQFLLSGFKSSVRGKELNTWLYRKGATGIETNVKNVGVEGNFYSQELDDLITDLENQHCDLVQDLVPAAPRSRRRSADSGSNHSSLLTNSTAPAIHYRHNGRPD